MEIAGTAKVVTPESAVELYDSDRYF